MPVEVCSQFQNSVVCTNFDCNKLEAAIGNRCFQNMDRLEVYPVLCQLKCEHTCWAARRRKVANLDEVGAGSPILRRNSLTGSFTATTAAVEVRVDVPVPGVRQAAALQPPVLDPVHHVAPVPNLIRLRVAHKVALKISRCSPQYLFQKVTSFILYKQG